jgi:ATP-binding protein involved in chromosome partitioning
MPIVGVIENMSGFDCECGQHHALFGEGGGARLAADLGVRLISQIPLDPHVVPGGDSGNPVVTANPESAAAQALTMTADELVQLIPPADMETCTGRIAKMLADLESTPA